MSSETWWLKGESINYGENSILKFKWEKLQFYIDEIKIIVDQLINWIDINSCKCSYFPLRSQVEMAWNWDIWVKFMWVKTWSEYAIENLAWYILNNEV